MNPRSNFLENVCPVPHPCSLDASKINDKTAHYENIVNSCQRHTCKLEAYCKSKNNACRFGFPFKLENTTRLEFSETNKSVKAEIKLKRNDQYLNTHNILTELCWQGNTDMQIILDEHAAISYMVKYAAKGEKAGSNLQEIYKTVIKHSKVEDNPISRLRALMLKTVSGKRDLGQCEVSRLLMAGNLYSSTFEYISQSLELKTSKLIKLPKNKEDNEAVVTSKSLIEFYANRADNAFQFKGNFYEFIKNFKVSKGEKNKKFKK
jgi:hypothetical protein